MSEFTFSENFSVTEEIKSTFEVDGYIIIKSVFSQEELIKIQTAIGAKGGVREHAYDLDDGAGLKSKMALWNHPGDDVTGMVGKCEKVAGTMEKLLGGEIYHYHSKLMMKEAKTGGQFVWHQDYGYWYNNGCLFPNMGSVMIAIDKCDSENGCLQVIKGSHKLGRIDHVNVADQVMADPVRLEEVKKHLPLEYASLDPGDAIFFHCNVLHRSDQNRSDRRRWVFICSYNRADNNPYFEHHHPLYTPLKKVSNDAILTCKNVSDFTGKWFVEKSDNKTLSR
ncbi:L-proline trans-4-hydroxylase-like [Antedon mediterranea]|uniref:L-proline trans-4-hydroxylase-like n=1 Tax=Antedon mediterranea TaxID=105859 RepID=UPI003AF6B914